MKKVLGFSIMGVVVIGGLCGFIFGRNGVAKNYYTRPETSKTEKTLYNIEKESRENMKSVDANEDFTVVDSELIKKNAESYAKETDQSQEKVEELMTKKSMETRAFYLAAQDEGISVTEREVSDAIEEVKTSYSKDETSKKQLQAIIAGSGMSEKEYWNNLRPEYEKNMVINKYLEEQYLKLAKKSNIEYGTEEYYKKIEVWREDLAEKAIQKYNIIVE